MLRIAGKIYIQNLPSALLLGLQLILISFIFNISFVMTTADQQMLMNINVPKGNFYFATGKERSGVNLEKLQEILGKDRVGYIERNGNKCVDGADTIKSPGVIYLGGSLSKISYELSSGQWFSGADHEVILGGDIASDYKVGDTLSISEENVEEKAVVVGILKSPSIELNFDTTCIDDFHPLLLEKESVLFTTDGELVKGLSVAYKVQHGICLLDLTDVSEQMVAQIKEEYNLCLVQDALDYAKTEQKKRTVKETFRLTGLLAIAFVSVAIQIFLYVRKYKRELNIFRMLGMNWYRIYGITMFGHVCNIGIGALGMYILFQSKGILARFGFCSDADLIRSGWYATDIFFLTYLLSTALIFGWVVHEEEKRETYYDY